MSYEAIALAMFLGMMGMLLTGQRVFAAIGFVAGIAALFLWGGGGSELPFSAAMKLMKWYPLMTLPLFIYMGYIMSESRIADDLYQMFHVWMGPIHGGLAIGTIALMVVISAMNGLSVAGMAIGATIALPELLRRGYNKVMVTGVIQAGSSLGILVPPSVVLVLYGMIARQPVGQLWLAGVFPRLDDGRSIHRLHCDSLPTATRVGAAAVKTRPRCIMEQKTVIVKSGHSSAVYFCLHDRFVSYRRNQPGGKLSGGRDGRHICCADKRPADDKSHGSNIAQDAGSHLHVYVDYHGRTLFRCGIRRAWRSQSN